MLPFPASVGFRFCFTFVIVSPQGICWMHYFNIINTIFIGENFTIWSCCHYKLPWFGRVNVFFITNNYIVFLYFCFLVPNVKLNVLIPQSKSLISTRNGSKLSQVLFRKISDDCFPFFFTIIAIGCYRRKLWKCYGFWYFFFLL